MVTSGACNRTGLINGNFCWHPHLDKNVSSVHKVCHGHLLSTSLMQGILLKQDHLVQLVEKVWFSIGSIEAQILLYTIFNRKSIPRTATTNPVCTFHCYTTNATVSLVFTKTGFLPCCNDNIINMESISHIPLFNSVLSVVGDESVSLLAT